MLGASRPLTPPAGGTGALRHARQRRADLLRVHGPRGPPDDPAVRRQPVRAPQLQQRQRRLPRALPAAVLRRLGLRALRPAADRLQRRGLGGRGRAAARRPRARPRAGARDVDGRHGDDGVHRQAPGPRDRRLRRLRHGALRRRTPHPVPLLAADGRVHADGRVLRRAHHPGRRRPLHRGQPRHLRGRLLDRGHQLGLHDPAGVPGDGAHGHRAPRPRHPPPDPVHQRHARHHDPARPGALGLLGARHRERGARVGAALRVPRHRPRRPAGGAGGGGAGRHAPSSTRSLEGGR